MAHGEPDRAAIFQRERSQLLAVAFRVLGSDADAQDVVQEAWLRYADTDTSEIRNLPAWLTTVVTRLCVDLLRRRREYPRQPAELPDPPATGGSGPAAPSVRAGASGPSEADEAQPSDVAGPEELALLAGELTAAWTVVLDRLTPPQRVALVLHDVFGLRFEDIAQVLGTTTGSAKKLASRARGRIRQSRRPDPDPAHPDAPTGTAAETAEARRVVRAFLHASREGDLETLLRLLDPNVVRTADPNVLPARGRMRLRGASVVARETRMFAANARRARLATIDDAPGIVVDGGSGHTLAVLTFRVVAGRITHYDVVADPRRLARLRIDD